jgi:hypothetical protein
MKPATSLQLVSGPETPRVRASGQDWADDVKHWKPARNGRLSEDDTRLSAHILRDDAVMPGPSESPRERE